MGDPAPRLNLRHDLFDPAQSAIVSPQHRPLSAGSRTLSSRYPVGRSAGRGLSIILRRGEMTRKHRPRGGMSGVVARGLVFVLLTMVPVVLVVSSARAVSLTGEQDLVIGLIGLAFAGMLLLLTVLTRQLKRNMIAAMRRRPDRLDSV